jgi:hypothetical protein
VHFKTVSTCIAVPHVTAYITVVITAQHVTAAPRLPSATSPPHQLAVACQLSNVLVQGHTLLSSTSLDEGEGGHRQQHIAGPACRHRGTAPVCVCVLAHASHSWGNALACTRIELNALLTCVPTAAKRDPDTLCACPTPKCLLSLNPTLQSLHAPPPPHTHTSITPTLQSAMETARMEFAPSLPLLSVPSSLIMASSSSFCWVGSLPCVRFRGRGGGEGGVVYVGCDLHGDG